MVEQSYADRLDAVFNRVKGAEEEVKNIKSPHETFRIQRTILESRVNELFESDKPKDNQNQIRECFYNLKSLEDKYHAQAVDDEEAFQQGRKKVTIALFNDLLDILGLTLSREIVEKHGGLLLDPSAHLDSPTRRGSATSQSERRSSSSRETTSLHSSDPDVRQGTNGTTHNEHGFYHPTQPDTEKPPPRADTRYNSTRTLTFDQVYQGGNASIKHLIIEYPKLSGAWYIVTCEKHGKRFYTDHPLSGGCRHLSSKQHNESGTREDAIRVLGIQVLNCSAELAEKNNLAVRSSLSLEEQNASSVHSKKSKGKKRRRGSDVELSDSIDWDADIETQPHRNSRRNEGIADPIVGELYSVYWEGDRRWYAGVVLSARDRVQPFVPSLNQTNLLELEKPDCYVFDIHNRISGWATGYEDGGPRVLDRLFPILFFDREKFPDSCQTAWVNSRNIKPFESVTKDLPFRNQVQQYLTKQQKHAASSKLVVHFGDQVTRVQSDVVPDPDITMGNSSTEAENNQPEPSPDGIRPQMNTGAASQAPSQVDTHVERPDLGQTQSSPDQTTPMNTTPPTKTEHSPTQIFQTMQRPDGFFTWIGSSEYANRPSFPTAASQPPPPPQLNTERSTPNTRAPPNPPPVQARMNSTPFERTDREPSSFNQARPSSVHSAPQVHNVTSPLSPLAAASLRTMAANLQNLQPGSERSAASGSPEASRTAGTYLPEHLQPFLQTSRSSAEAFANRLTSFTAVNTERRESR